MYQKRKEGKTNLLSVGRMVRNIGIIGSNFKPLFFYVPKRREGMTLPNREEIHTICLSFYELLDLKSNGSDFN